MSASIEPGKDNVFYLKGELTFETVTHLLNQSKKLFAEKQEITIDLTGITHSNSAGLTLLLEWLSENGTKELFQFTGVPDTLNSIAHLYNIDSCLDKAIRK